MQEFAIRVGRDERGNIISLHLADLKLELLDVLINEADLNKRYRSYVASTLKNHKNIANGLRQITPKTIKELKSLYENGSTEDDYLYHWETFEIEFNKQYAIFSKLLPTTGIVATTIEVAMNSVITYMALRITSSSDDSSSDTSMSLSISGAILDALMLIIMYIGSDATGLLTRIGERIDQSIEQCCSNEQDTTLIISREQSNRSNYLKNTATFFIISCIVIGIIITVISAYQEVILLIDKYLSLSPERSKEQTEREKHLLQLGLKLLVFASSYTSLAFQSSLALNMIHSLFNKIELRKNRETPPGLHFQYRSIPGNGFTHARDPLLQQEPLNDDLFPVARTRRTPSI